MLARVTTRSVTSRLAWNPHAPHLVLELRSKGGLREVGDGGLRTIRRGARAKSWGVVNSGCGLHDELERLRERFAATAGLGSDSAAPEGWGNGHWESITRVFFPESERSRLALPLALRTRTPNSDSHSALALTLRDATCFDAAWCCARTTTTEEGEGAE